MKKTFSQNLKTRLIILFFVLLSSNLLTNNIFIKASTCDKVGNFLSDFQYIMPNYEQLTQFHIVKYFFIENDPEYNKMKIRIDNPSILKIVITPRKSKINIRINKNQNQIFNQISDQISITFTDLEATPGEYILEIEKLEEFENDGKTEDDEICNQHPYIMIDFYIEEFKHFEIKSDTILKKNKKLDDMEFDLNPLIQETLLESNKDVSSIEDSESDVRLGKFLERKVNLTPIKYCFIQ